MAQKLLAMLDELLFPEDVLCLCCECALDAHAGEGICPACAQALEELAHKQELREAEENEPTPEGIAYVHAAYPYEGPAKTLIRRLKYGSIRAACVPLARRMAYLPSEEEEILVPVPTDRIREKKRGFNQAALLAQEIGKTLGMEVCPALHRISGRRPQTGLSRAQRRMNLVGCMEANASVKGKRVLLVDDVYTTGATAQEAARALREAGAASVAMLAAARAGAESDEGKDLFALSLDRTKGGVLRGKS